jgi:hypothetical protein
VVTGTGVGATGIGVGVAVGVGNGVAVDVSVGTTVGVTVGTGDKVAVAVCVGVLVCAGVLVGVAVAAGVEVSAGSGVTNRAGERVSRDVGAAAPLVSTVVASMEGVASSVTVLAIAGISIADPPAGAPGSGSIPTADGVGEGVTVGVTVWPADAVAGEVTPPPAARTGAGEPRGTG